MSSSKYLKVNPNETWLALALSVHACKHILSVTEGYSSLVSVTGFSFVTINLIILISNR